MKLQFREGWSSLLLILGMLLAVAWSLDAAQWTDGLGLLQWAVIIGLLWGLAGARSIFPGWFMHASAVIQGVFWTAVLAGSLLPAKLSGYEKVEELRLRYWSWLGRAMSGNTNTDNLIFLMECLLVVFFISYAAAWFAYRRHSTWQVIMPAGVVLVLNIYNAQGSHSVFLFLYLLCALLFAVRMHLSTQETWWQKARIGYNRMVALDFLRDGAIFSVLVILLAQAVPAAAANSQVAEAIQRLDAPWQGVREKWGTLFATLNYKPEPTGAGFFGSALTLGGALHLNNTPMMEGRMEGARYWEAVTYDKYNGKGWENTDTVSLAVHAPDARLANIPFALREPVTQTIKVFYPTSQLFGAPMPVAWNKPIVAQLNRDPNASTGDAAPASIAPVMISMAYSGIPTRANDEYTVLSLVSKADKVSLRKAATTYPDWVAARYLPVPASVPARVKILADRVLKQANAENNFDKADALESYLRQFTYNEFIQAPPPERDVVDYFLFTSRQGYCNYYASSMAVMLRLEGIPARVVSGYARGEYSSETGVYKIRESDSHTWVEAFFPSYGWIQFEPTASQPTLDRIEGSDQPADTTNATDGDPSGRIPSGRNKDDMLDELSGGAGSGGVSFPVAGLQESLAGIGYLTIFAVLAGVVAMAAVAIGWQRHVASLTVLESEYEGMQRYARWMGATPRAAQTPHEFAEHLALRIPESASNIFRLADLYVRSLFTRDGLSKAEEREARGLWPQIRKNFLVYMVQSTLVKLLHPPIGANTPGRKK